MRAVVITQPGGPEALQVIQAVLPEPAAGEVRIRVAAAAVNPVDVITRQGVFHELGWITQPATTGLGWDVAGTIDALGAGVEGWAKGAVVAALLAKLNVPLGTYAEYVIVPAEAVAAIPFGLTAAQAATLPLNALTADQALDLLDLPAGASLLVTGAAGAVGGFAVALAARRGLRVTAVARAGDEAFVRDAGAETWVTDLHDLQGHYDGVLDAASQVEPALTAVKDGGVYVGVTPSSVPASVRGIRTDAVRVRADGVRLAELLALAADGSLQPRIAGSLPLVEAAQAQRNLEQGGQRGRWVLIP